jgi:hypothetical protein
LPCALRLGCRRLCSVGLCLAAAGLRDRQPRAALAQPDVCVQAVARPQRPSCGREREGQEAGVRRTLRSKAPCFGPEDALGACRSPKQPTPAHHAALKERHVRARPILCSPALASAGSEAADGPAEGSAPQLDCRRGMCGLRRVAHNDAQGRRSSCSPLGPDAPTSERRGRP